MTAGNAAEASDFTLRHLSGGQWEEMRALMRADVWLFSTIACDRKQFAVRRFHAPLTYLLAGQTHLLIRCLDHPDYQSEVTRQVRLECQRRGIDYRTPAGAKALDAVLKSGVNDRIFRSGAKTTQGKDVLLWIATNNPNDDIALVSKSEPAAWEICDSIGKVMLGQYYGATGTGFFPECIPEKRAHELITKSAITLATRTATAQPNIMAKGLNSQWTSLHFNHIYCDDIVGTESGEASVGDAHRFLAAIEGISKSDVLGGTRRIFQGTIYGADDDNSVLVRDQSVFSIHVPIWIKDHHGIDHLMEDGEPTLPEWYDLEACRAKRAKTLTNRLEGPTSWLQNFEMTAHLDGASVFTWDLLQRCEYREWVDRDGKAWIAVPRDAKLTSKQSEITAKSRPLWRLNDLTTLDLAMGIDQAFSLSTGADQWCIFLAGQDHTGDRYLLDMVAGRGYEEMLAWIVPKWILWGRPRIIGMDAAAQQSATTDWMKRSSEFALIASCLKPVKSTNVAKHTRFFNYLAAGFRAGTLHLSPKLYDFREQAVKWRPGMSNPGVDDILDAAAIAIEVLQGYVYDRAEDEIATAQYISSFKRNRDSDGLSRNSWDAVLE